jgi:hypothetical protein
MLAKEIERFPALWRISDEGYMRRDITSASWKIVSENTEIPGKISRRKEFRGRFLINASINVFLIAVAECKSNWKSLKDALNYRQKSKPGKSGDGAPEPEGLETEDLALESEAQKSLEAWIFYDSLKFLLDNKPQRS